MRKFTLLIALVVAYTCSLLAQAPTVDEDNYTVAWYQGFETASRPTGWTETILKKTSGNNDVFWTYANGGGYINSPDNRTPKTAKDGGYNTLFYVNDLQASTRLESPWWSLTSPINVEKPALTFWLAQPSRQGVDKLTVVYRIDPNSSVWIPLETYTTSIEEWTKKIIVLPDEVKGKNIQIGFEATANLGLGVSIDRIMIIDVKTTPRKIRSLSLIHNSTNVATGTSVNPLAMLETTVEGATNTLKISSLTFNYTGTSVADLNNLKLFLTKTNTFTTETPLNDYTYSTSGNTVTLTSNSIGTAGVLNTGLNYIWLCADIASTASHNNLTSFEIPANGLTTKLVDKTGTVVETEQHPAETQSPPGGSTIEESLFIDDFESGSAKWLLGTGMQIGSPTGLGDGDPATAYAGTGVLASNLSGNYPANIPEGSNYFITSQTINAKFYKNLSIKYRRWLNLETADKANILISTDGGATWTKLYENIAGMYDTYWISQSLDISNQATRKAQVSIKIGLGYTDGTGERGGWNIDNFAVTGDFIAQDIGIESYNGPQSGCGMSANTQFSLTLRNYGGEPITDPVDIGYTLDGTNWVYDTFTGTIPVDGSVPFTFTTTADLSQPGKKNINFKTTLATDEDQSNNQLSVAIYSYPTLSTPLNESFETLINHWYPYGTNSSWQWGTPASSNINGASNGISTWMTGISTNYKSNEQSYLESPCIALNGGETNWVLSFLYKSIVQEGIDGFNLEYSIDGGITWQLLPAHALYATNWLPTATVEALSGPGWSQNTPDYTISKTLIPADAVAAGSIKVRFVFKSNQDTNAEGVAIDLVRIYPLTHDIGISELQSPNTSCEIGLSPLTFKLKNYSKVKTYPTGDITISFSSNSDPTKTETFTLDTPLAPEQEKVFTTAFSIDFNKETLYDISINTLLTEDDNTANDTLSSSITILGMPNYQVIGADLNTIGIETLNPTTPYTLDAGSGFETYTWKRDNLGSWETIASTQTTNIEEYGYYQITVTNTNGCSKSVDINVIPSTLDVSVESVSGFADACVQPSSISPSIVLRNIGRDLTEGESIPVAIRSNGYTVLTENITVPTGGIATSTTYPYTFTSGIDLSEKGVYTIAIGTRYSGDTDYSNDFTAEQIVNTWGAPEVDVMVLNKFGTNPRALPLNRTIKSLQPDTLSFDAGTGYATYKWERKLLGTTNWVDISSSAINGGERLPITVNNSADYRLTVSTLHGCGEAVTEFTINAKDLGIFSIEGLEEDYCQTEEGITFNVVIQNYGLDTYPVGTILDLIFNTPVGDQTLNVELTEPLSSGQTQTVALPTPIKLALGMNAVRVATNMEDDCDPTNDSRDVNIMVKRSPTVTISPDVIKSVFTSSSELTISPTYSEDCSIFNWNTGATTRNLIIYGIPDDSYTVTATNEEGCSASASVSIITTDLKVVGIIDPVSKCSLDDNLPEVTVAIANSGSKPFPAGTVIDFKLYLDGTLVLNGEESFTLTNPLDINSTTTFTFTNVNAQTLLNGLNTASIKAEAMLNGIEDINLSNNALTTTIISTGYPVFNIGSDHDVHAWTEELSANPDPGYISYLWEYSTSVSGTYETVGTSGTYIASQQTEGKGDGFYRLTVTDPYGCIGSASTKLSFFIDDMEATDITSPVSGCSKTDTEPITITLKNNSSWILPAGTSYQIGVTIGSNPEIIEDHTLASQLIPEGTLTQTLNTVANIVSDSHSLKSTNITVRVILPNDMNEANNSYTETVESYPNVGFLLMGGIDEQNYTTPTFELDASGFDGGVEWTLNGSLAYATGDNNTPIIEVSGSGTACARVFNSQGCYADDCITLTYDNPDIAISEITGPTNSCGLGTQENFSVKFNNQGNNPILSGTYIQLSAKQTKPNNEIVDIDLGFILATDIEKQGEYTHTFLKALDLSAPGTHNIEITTTFDENVTNNTLATQISSFASISVSLPNNTNLCQGSTTTLDAQVPDAQSYVWTKDGLPFAETKVIEVNQGGVYDVVVTSTDGCTATGSATITSIPLPVVNLGADAAYCTGQTVTLNAENSGSTYVWSKDGETLSETQQQLEVNQAGEYAVIVTTIDGCVGSDNIVVTFDDVININIQGETTLCTNDDPITLDAGSYGTIYSWTKDGEALTETTSTITVNTSGTYVVSTTNNDGCIAEGSITVTTVDAPTVNLGDDRAICQGQTVTLNPGVDNATYLWSTGAITQTIGVSAAGDYSVTVTDANGCTASDEVSVVVKPRPSITLGDDIETCLGEEITLTAPDVENVVQYRWNDGTTGKILTVTQTGTYTITVTHENGCTGNDGILVTFNPLPEFDLGPETLKVNFPHTLTANIENVQYLWSTSETTQSISAPGPDEYWLTVTDSKGCEYSDTIKLQLADNVGYINGIGATVNIFPNPVSDELRYTISSETPAIFSVELFSVTGQTVWKEQTALQAEVSGRINVSSLKSGLYLLKVSTAKKSVTLRVIVQ